MLDIISSIIIGIIQGISEWLPISSKTQILLASYFLLKINLSVAYVFGLFMEIGTVMSAIVYFRKDIINVLKNKKLLFDIIFITIITGLVGVPLYILSDKLLKNAYNLGIPMFILGLILIIDGLYIQYSRKIKIREFKELKKKDLLLIGFAQGLAALPGVSRSGATVSTMLLLKTKPEDAFRYSYLLYILSGLGAFGVTLLLNRGSIGDVINIIGLSGLIISIVVAFLVGLLTIDILLRIARKENIYIINYILGSIAIIFSLLWFI